MDLLAEEHGGDHEGGEQEGAQEELSPVDTGHFLAQIGLEKEEQDNFGEDGSDSGGTVAEQRQEDEVGDDIEGDSDGEGTRLFAFQAQSDQHIVGDAVEPADGDGGDDQLQRNRAVWQELLTTYDADEWEGEIGGNGRYRQSQQQHQFQ